MEALEAVRAVIRGRRSVRSGYSDRPISQSMLRDIVEAGVFAPTGSNTQSVRFAVESRPQALARLAGIRRDADKVLSAVSAVIVVLIDKQESKSGPIWGLLRYQDAAAAIQNMLLLATALRLGSCWISAYEQMAGTRLMSGKQWADALPGIDHTRYAVMGLVALGHTAGAPEGDELHRGRWVGRRQTDAYVLEMSE